MENTPEVPPTATVALPDPLADACVGLEEAVTHALTNWLADDLANEQFTRLERAGKSGHVPLAKVFVDAEVTQNPSLAEDTNTSGTSFLWLLANDSRREDAESIESHETDIDGSSNSRPDSVAAYLLIGGPGQGKSTVMQQLCQLQRAALLRPRKAQLTEEQRTLVEDWPAEGWKEKPYFPISIALADAAAWLSRHGDSAANDKVPALLRFALEGKTIDGNVMLHVWSRLPPLFVLDGLDEVPGSEDRQRVLAAMRELFQRFPRRGLVIATTRPQGYSGEFGSIAPAAQTCYLTKLSPYRATEYAKKLIAASFPEAEKADLEARVHEALRGDATKRLMTTPLHVTIMVQLINRLGRAPSERWVLFEKYYRAVYDRETERRIPAAELLRKYRAHIDKMHAQVGLLLQAESELSGGTESWMSPARFGQVIDAVLTEDDVEGKERKLLADRLVTAIQDVAVQRLVLLVERSPGKHVGRLGFEVRAIQEYMAAWALSQKNETLVAERLRVVAKASSFRHVVLFLASKAFSDLSDLRDEFVNLCVALNDDPQDALARESLAGSVLALEILEEGSASVQHKYVRQLLEIAIRLISLPPSLLHGRLAQACVQAMDVARPILQKAIAERLRDDVPEKRLGAWVVLVAISEAEPWARTWAESQFGAHSSVRKHSIRALVEARIAIPPWFFGVATESLHDIPPQTWTTMLRDHRIFRNENALTPPLRVMWHLLERRQVLDIDILNRGNDTGLSLRVHAIQQNADVPWSALAQLPEPSPEWSPLVSAARLIVDPTKETLAANLSWLADRFDGEAFQRVAKRIPWPLGDCLAVVRNAEDLRNLAAKAAAGELGDGDIWIAAETRIRSGRKIDRDELLTSGFDDRPFGVSISTGGVPICSSSIYFDATFEGHEGGPWLAELRSRFANTASWQRKRLLANWCIVILHVMASDGARLADPMSPDDLEQLWATTQGLFPIQILAPLRPWDHPDLPWPDFLVRLGHSRNVGISKTPASELARYLSDLYNEDPSRTGLLPLLKLIVVYGERTKVNPAYLQPDQFDDERLRHDAYLIRFAQGDVDPNLVEAECAALAKASAGAWWPIGFILNIIETGSVDPRIAEPALVGLCRNMPPDGWDLARAAIERMRVLMRARQSGLSDTATWNRLRLPHPRPEKAETTKSPPPSVQIRSIASISIENVRSFDTLKLEFSPPRPDQGQWVVLLGENGVGKTTILRAIALAFRGRERLPRAGFEAPWRRKDIAAEVSSFVDVQLQGAKGHVEISTGVEEDDFDVKTDLARVPIFGYGCRRGSALGGSNKESEPKHGRELDTLFDEAADVLNAEVWLRLRDQEQKDEDDPNGPAHRIFRAVIDALEKILRVERVRVQGAQIVVDDATRGTIPVRALSDGYLTMTGWVVDLIARWVSRPDQENLIEEGFTQTMTGLVLIDEIDLHLHPAWQTHVIEDVRKVFPRMSFVVTTHNPATVAGARAEEIWILRNDEGATRAHQRSENPKLMTGSEIYTTYFEVPHINPTFAENMQRYGFLAGMVNRTDEEEREVYELLRKLRDEGADPGWEPVARVVGRSRRGRRGDGR